MEKQIINLTEQEINEQKIWVKKFKDLINKEISYGDLANLNKLKKYTDALQFHMNLIVNPFIEMPVIK